jgi:hypothetical protein
MKCLKKSLIAAAIGLAFSAGVMAQTSPGSSPSTTSPSTERSTSPTSPPAARTSPGAVDKTPATGMPDAEYKQGKDRISADAKAAKAQCDSLQKNAKDVCMAEAKGKEKVARAELEVAYKPTDKNRRDATNAKADAEYDVAKEKCDDMTGDSKDACQKQAKAQHVAAKAEGRPAPSGGASSSGGMSDKQPSRTTPGAAPGGQPSSTPGTGTK